MNDYMTALHQRFFREPDFSKLEEEIEQTRQEVRDCLDKLQRRKLMHLVDTQNLLRKEISLASFTAGFKLAWGIAKELEADGLYSFDCEQEHGPAKQQNRRCTTWQRNGPTGKAASENGRTAAGRGGTRQATMRKLGSLFTRMCWAEPNPSRGQGEAKGLHRAPIKAAGAVQVK